MGVRPGEHASACAEACSPVVVRRSQSGRVDLVLRAVQTSNLLTSARLLSVKPGCAHDDRFSMGKVLASLASSDSGWLVPDYGSSFVRRLEADFTGAGVVFIRGEYAFTLVGM